MLGPVSKGMGPFNATYAIFFVDRGTMYKKTAIVFPPEDADWIRNQLLVHLNVDLDDEWKRYWLEIPPGNDLKASLAAFWDKVRRLAESFDE